MLRRGTACLAAGVVFTVVVLAGTVRPVSSQKLSCSDVLAMSTRLEREAPSKSHDPIYLGRRLKAEPYWMERCLNAYGRPVSRHAPITDEAKEKLQEWWETWPHEKAAPEDEGDVVRKVERRRKRPPESQEPAGWEGLDTQGDTPTR